MKSDNLNKHFNSICFPAGKTQSEDHPFWLQLEKMIYSHVWESNKFLKQLYRLEEVAEGKRYSWIVEIPESSKHIFIRTTIRDGFRKKGLKIAEIMQKGFHTSLRNSFLHSEYEIEETNGVKKPADLLRNTFNQK